MDSPEDSSASVQGFSGCISKVRVVHHSTDEAKLCPKKQQVKDNIKHQNQLWSGGAQLSLPRPPKTMKELKPSLPREMSA